VWLDEKWLFEWLEDAPPGLIWYSHTAVADAAARRGERVIPQGETPPPAGDRRVWVSTHSHTKGLNLQSYDKNIVLTPQAAADMEQLLGRTHRQGQTADTVYCEVLTHTRHTAKTWAKSRKQAAWLQESTGQRQKLCLATHRREES